MDIQKKENQTEKLYRDEEHSGSAEFTRNVFVFFGRVPYMSSSFRGLSHRHWNRHLRTCPDICQCACHRKCNYSIRKALALSLSGSFLNVNTAPFTFSTATTLNLQDLIQTEHEKEMHCDDDLLSTPSTKIKSFLGSFASTMKRSMKHAVTQQSLSLQNRCLRAELQSRDTAKFLSSAHQALFEEILAEKIWSLYHFEPTKYGQGVPVHVLFNEVNAECIERGLCDSKNIDGTRTFDHRLLTLTKLHASYHEDIWLRMHQLPFHRDSNHSTESNDGTKSHRNIRNGANLRPFAFKSSASKSGSTSSRPQSLSRITTEDVIGCNIDRTGRIAWYYLPDHESKLLFFPGIFEADTIFIGNALNAVQELDSLLNDSKHSHNTHLLLQCSALLENTKMAFFEQELWRFLSYYPSGGGHQTLLDCHSLFGVDSKDTMRQYLRKYVYREQSGHCPSSEDVLFCVFPEGNRCAIQYEKEHDFFTVNRRLPLMEQIAAFQQHYDHRLQSLKERVSSISFSSSDSIECMESMQSVHEDFASLFRSCLSSHCRLFYDVRLLKSIFWSWCHSVPSTHPSPTLQHFEQMASDLMAKYHDSLRGSLGGGNRYLLELSRYEYRLLRQLWFMGTRRGLFESKNGISPSRSFVVGLSKLALDHHDVDWFLSILNVRILHRIEMNASFVYGALFNVVQDTIQRVVSEATSSSKSEEQLIALMRALNASYRILPRTVGIGKGKGYGNVTPITKEVNHRHLNQRFIQMFASMEELSNYEALRQIEFSTLDQHFTRFMARKLEMDEIDIERLDTLADLMQIHRAKKQQNVVNHLEHSGMSQNGTTTALKVRGVSGINLEVVGFHHDLQQRRFNEAVWKLEALRTMMTSTRGLHSERAVQSAVRILTLPTDPKIWRTAREASRNKVNLHAVKLEIPSIIHLCLDCIRRLPVDQEVMAQCLNPMADIMEHITREHGSMKLCHSIFGRILRTAELPVPVSMVNRYLDLYGEYDQFLSSPIPILEGILRRYIPPSILSYTEYSDQDLDGLSHSESDFPVFDDEDGLHMKGLRDFSAMTKTDGIDDKLDPFGASFTADSGYRILPIGVYHKMLNALNLYSSVHGLGHFNLRIDHKECTEDVSTPSMISNRSQMKWQRFGGTVLYNEAYEHFEDDCHDTFTSLLVSWTCEL